MKKATVAALRIDGFNKVQVFKADVIFYWETRLSGVAEQVNTMLYEKSRMQL